MYWSKEDLDEAGRAVSTVFGPQAQMSESAEIKDIVIWTPAYGKLWYGDIATEALLRAKCVALGNKLSSKVVYASKLDAEAFYTAPQYKVQIS